MGVTGLATYIKRVDPNRRAWKGQQQIEGPLVIDGSQLCYQFYRSKRLDVINGGEYPEFYKKVSKFLENLQQSGIVPHVVFEGIDKGQKLTDNYLLKRKAERHMKTQRELETRVSMTGLPQLAYTTLCNVLTDLNINCYVPDGEGDEACVRIAKFLNCPVLSNDSDYYLFDIPNGYIQLGEFEPPDRPKRAIAIADVYYRDLFVREVLRFHEGDLLYLIPSLLGNGIVPHILSGQIAEQISRAEPRRGLQDLDWIFSYLKQMSSLQSCLGSIDNAELTQQVEDVTTYYNPDPLNPEDLLGLPIANGDLPQWFMLEYRKHAIPYMLVDALVNEKQHHSDLLVSIHIRKCCYRILGVEKVKEYHIKDNRAVRASVKWADSDLNLPNVSEVPDMPQEERKSHIFSILGVTHAQWPVDVQEQEKLFMSTIVFWKTKMRPPSYLVKALLACFVICSSTNPETLQAARSGKCRYIPEDYKRSTNWLSDRQLFLDWQSVYRDLVALSILLQCSSELCPSKIYDGRIAMSLSSRAEGIEGVVASLENFDLNKYRALCRFILP